jgi:hypothetical protein
MSDGYGGAIGIYFDAPRFRARRKWRSCNFVQRCRFPVDGKCGNIFGSLVHHIKIFSRGVDGEPSGTVSRKNGSFAAGHCFAAGRNAYRIVQPIRRESYFLTGMEIFDLQSLRIAPHGDGNIRGGRDGDDSTRIVALVAALDRGGPGRYACGNARFADCHHRSVF